MLVEFLVGTGCAETVHANEDAVGADQPVPALPDAGFDRDLHPQWLPSNIDAAERENLSSNLMSLQFLPNKGMDIGATPIEVTDGPEMYELGDGFDLYLDDVRFITDASSCMGSSSEYDFTPHNDPGGSCDMKSDAGKYNDILATMYMHWKNEFLQGGWVNMPEQTSHGSTSESQGYGLIHTHTTSPSI